MLEIHGKNETIWNVTYSTWGPNNVDLDLAAQHYKSPDNIYVTPVYNSSILALSTDGRKKPAQWVGEISSVAISFFDVFHPKHDENDKSKNDNKKKDSLILLPQPNHLKDYEIDPKTLSSAFVQKTKDGQWFAMSGKNFPSLVHSAPVASWCQAPNTFKGSIREIENSLIGVHPLSFPEKLVKPSDSSKDLLAIEDGSRNKNVDKYKKNNAVIRHSTNQHSDNPVYQHYEMARQQDKYAYQHQNVAERPGLPPPSSIITEPTSVIYSSFVRIIENVFAFVIFFGALIAAAKLGWLPQLANGVEMIHANINNKKMENIGNKEFEEKPDLVIVQDEKNAQEEYNEVSSDSQQKQLQQPKKVEIVEPEKSINNKEEGTENESQEQQNSSGSATSTPHKRRKRGTRGGKNSKAKKKLLQQQLQQQQQSGLETLENNQIRSESLDGDVTPRLIDQIQEDRMVEGNSNINTSQIINGALRKDLIGSASSILLAPTLSSSLKCSEEVLGYGSHGTVVFKGEFENREVAVKRMLLEFYDVASHEVSLLQESDDHPNVIRYYCKQQTERFLYIALELCPGTLEDLVEKKPNSLYELNNYISSPTQIMYQIASGVQHLHSLKIVHRDLKPQNILVAPPKVSKRLGTGNSESGNAPGSSASNSISNNNSIRMLISDFGLCKMLEGDQSSFRATTAQAAGTSGWRAPELLLDDLESNTEHFKNINGNANNNSTMSSSTNTSSEPLIIDSISNRRATRAIDIFSLGCVFYYILSKGQHPFGDKILREANIVQNLYSLDYLDPETSEMEDAVEARDLVERMIARNPKQRPEASEVLLHPLFWSVRKRLDFLLKVSDRFEIELRDPPSELFKKLERHAPEVVGQDWHSRLDKLFVDNLGKYRKYHGDRILDLLRAMRNKAHHYNDLPPELRTIVGGYPEGYYKYFLKRFPKLLMVIYKVVREEGLYKEDMFVSFFTNRDSL